jgi:hypothetical protein
MEQYSVPFESHNLQIISTGIKLVSHERAEWHKKRAVGIITNSRERDGYYFVINSIVSFAIH